MASSTAARSGHTDPEPRHHISLSPVSLEFYICIEKTLTNNAKNATNEEKEEDDNDNVVQNHLIPVNI